MDIERENGTCRMRITDDPVFRAFDFRSAVLDRLTDEDQLVMPSGERLSLTSMFQARRRCAIAGKRGTSSRSM